MAIGLLVAIVVFVFGTKVLQIGKMMTQNGDAADDSVERNCERRRLGADVVGGRFDLGGTGRGRFQRAWRSRQQNRVRKWRYREERRFIASTRRVGRRGAFAVGRS